MGKEGYYINGVGIISPQFTYDNGIFLTQLQTYEENVLKCVTPDFKTLINPVQLRRLSRLLRIGLSAAIICLRDAKRDGADGIITATGYGFLDDQAKFLGEVLEQKEQQVTPTNFMQSTYNALGGLVALHVKCKGYNNTYVSKGFAFETALFDAMMQLKESASRNFLIGSFDEADLAHFKINTKAGGYYKADPINSLSLFNDPTPGFLQGEGVAFFLLSGLTTEQTWCSIKDLRMLFKPSLSDLSAAVYKFLEVNGIDVGAIDVLINGASGDVARDQKINNVVDAIFSRTVQLKFKHLCGEYCTAASFGCWLGASILKQQKIPATLNAELSKSIENILIINHYMDKNYTFILLQR